jgi:hypothetical protein
VQVIEIRKTVLGAEHPDTLSSMASLASTYWNQGRWNEAEKLDMQIMETRKIVLGAEHPDTLNSMANLAYTWQSQRRPPDALALIETCCRLRNKELGPDHPHTRDSFQTLNDWENQHKSLLNGTLPPSNTQIERSECLPEVIAQHNAAPTTAQSRSEEHFKLPHSQGRLAAGFFLGDHPLIIASRALPPAPGSQDLHEID